MDKTDVASSKKEIQEQLNKQYIDTKINPIVEPMAMDFFNQQDRPGDVVSIWSFAKRFLSWFSDLKLIVLLIGRLDGSLHEAKLRKQSRSQPGLEVGTRILPEWDPKTENFYEAKDQQSPKVNCQWSKQWG